MYGADSERERECMELIVRERECMELIVRERENVWS